MTLKLGKKPAREGAVKLKLADYSGTLPTPPASFGWDYLIKPDAWGMLGNGPDGKAPEVEPCGDCVIAGGLHETLLYRATARLTTPLSSECAVKNYSALTGYDPSDPSTDQGADMELAAKYRRKTGLVDAAGKRHKVGAYLSLALGDIEQLRSALWIFGAVGLGIEFPAFAMDDFARGKTWDVQRANAKIEGGHYLSLVGADENLRAVTWGGIAELTPKFIAKYADELIVYLSTESLTKGVNLNGFKLAALQDDLKQLTAA